MLAQTSRENTYAELRRILDENIRSRMKGDEKFQSFVREELAMLKNSVSLERQTRERDDGEIVDALVRIRSAFPPRESSSCFFWFALDLMKWSRILPLPDSVWC